MCTRSSRYGLFHRWLTSTTALAGILPMLALTAPAAHANPEGGSVMQGAATITQTNPKTVTVNQTTDKAVINWRSFSIGADETTRFNQPSSSSTTLNRVTGDQVSQILGNLSANGKVFLVNPNGIVFGAGSKIDVAALVASTADIKNENFMAGSLRFDVPGKAAAEIVNQGTITAADGGLVALVAPVLRNSGIIQARLGKVALASANGVTLDLYGDNLILFQAADKITEQMVSTNGKPITTAIDNSGQIYADGGRVLMTANTAKGVVDNAINTTGLVSARAVEQQGGEIVLKSEDAGIVQVAGRIDASGTGTGQTGGRVQVTGEKIGLFEGTRIDASGDTGGGTVVVGGDYLGGNASDETLAQLGIRREDHAIATATYTNMASGARIAADALSSGNGGKVVLWSDNRTIAYGAISAKGGAEGGAGGFIEVSGKKHLEIASLKADASAAAGKAGTVLYDPGNVYITSDADAVASYNVTDFTSTTPWDGRTNIAASNIEAVLNSGTNVVIRATPEGPNVDSWGDVYVQHSISKTQGGEAMLSLFSADEIHVESGVNITSTSGKLNLYFDADYDRHSYGGIFLDAGSAIRTNGGFVNLNGSDIYRNGLVDTSVTHPDSSGNQESGKVRKAHDYFSRVDFTFLTKNYADVISSINKTETTILQGEINYGPGVVLATNGAQGIPAVTKTEISKEYASEIAPYARLAESVYGEKKIPDGYVEIPGTSAVDTVFFLENGFRANAYYDTKNEKIVISFAGTDDVGNDLATDVGVFSGASATQDQWIRAMEYYGSVISNPSVKKLITENRAQIVLTGHSLGGAFAQYIGAQTGYETFAFNPAAVPQNVADTLNISNNNNNVHIIRSNADPVSSVTGGSAHLSSDIVNVFDAGIHGIGALVDAIEKRSE